MNLFTLGFASDEDLEFFTTYAFEEFEEEAPALTVSEFTVQFELSGETAEPVLTHLRELLSDRTVFDNGNAWNLPTYFSVRPL